LVILHHFVDIKTVIMVYYSIVNSHLLYGILSWGGECKSVIKSLQIIQNKILKIICNVQPMSHTKYDSVYFKLKLLR